MVTKYLCKKDVDKGRAYNILRGPIFRNWPASGFSDFQNGNGFVRFKHKSGADVVVTKEEARNKYNIAISVECVDYWNTTEDCWNPTIVFRDLSEALNIRLVSRRCYV